MDSLVWIEIEKNNLVNNIKTFRKIGKDNTILAPCVKANAFGHGLVPTAKLFLRAGADWLCVNSIAEAEELRSQNVKAPILVIGYVQKSDLKKVFELNLRIFVYNLETAIELSSLSKSYRQICNLHFKIDTGMGRQGTLLSEADSMLEQLFILKGINIEGLATHFATADGSVDNNIFKQQLHLFNTFVRKAQNKYKRSFITHCSNSAASLIYPEAQFNLVRPGISVYGYYPNEDIKQLCHKNGIVLKPAFTLKTKVAQIKKVPKNHGVSYGSTFVAKAPIRVILLPVGYNEGLTRNLSNRGFVYIKGKKANILGRVCMHMTMVDGNKISGIKLEDVVTVFGKIENEENTISKIAELMQTNVNELLVKIPKEIPRYFV